MYEQSLVKVIKDHIKPNILKKNNIQGWWDWFWELVGF